MTSRQNLNDSLLFLDKQVVTEELHSLHAQVNTTTDKLTGVPHPSNDTGHRKAKNYGQTIPAGESKINA
jgi:hypothetical protein